MTSLRVLLSRVLVSRRASVGLAMLGVLALLGVFAEWFAAPAPLLATGSLHVSVDRWESGPIRSSGARFEQRVTGRAGDREAALVAHTLGFTGPDHEVVLCSIACAAAAGGGDAGGRARADARGGEAGAHAGVGAGAADAKEPSGAHAMEQRTTS